MSQVPIEPQLQSESRLKTGRGWRNIASIIIVCILASGFGLGIWQLRPKQTPTGRPIGTAGKVQAFALRTHPAGEGFSIWRDGRQVYVLPNEFARDYQRIEMSSNDVDIVGTSAPDLVLYAWTGGAHCCFTQILIDGQSGRLLGQLELGNSDPMPFIPAQRRGFARAVVVNYDDISAYKFGSYADSPMARIVVAWDGKRFGLDHTRMKATQANLPPAYFIGEPDLGDAVALGNPKYGEREESASTTSVSATTGGPRGDRTQFYIAWMVSEEARMANTILNPDDLTSYGPMAAFLNERVYKGHGVAGVASVMAAHEATPEARDVAVAYYFGILEQSRWFGDLNKLNDGQLTRLIAPPARAPRHTP